MMLAGLASALVGCWSRAWFTWALLLMLAGSGCGASGRLTADPTDYAQYRQVRVADSFERRLSAGWTYLRTQPQGRWRAEVETWFRSAEERYLRRAWARPSSLYGYLAVLPDGPHAAEVRARIFALEETARTAAIDESSLMRQERARQQRFDAAAQQRTAFRAALAGWLTLLGGERLPGSASEQWSPEFSRRFFEIEPPGNCVEQRCQKTDRFEYQLPIPEGLETHAATVQTTLQLTGGRVERVVVSGYGLFNAIAESVSLERVPHDDLQARAEAIGTAVQFIGAAVEPVFPFSRCDREAFSPTVLSRQCDGQRLDMVVAESFEQADRIELSAQLSEDSENSPAEGANASPESASPAAR